METYRYTVIIWNGEPETRIVESTDPWLSPDYFAELFGVDWNDVIEWSSVPV